MGGSSDTKSWTYDGNGNPTEITNFSGTFKTYTWNAQNQQTSVSVGSITRNLEKDKLGRKVLDEQL